MTMLNNRKFSPFVDVDEMPGMRHFQDAVGSRFKEVPVAAVGRGGCLIPHFAAYSKA